VSTLRVGNLTAVGGTGTITVPSGNVLTQAGTILQVLQAVKTDTFTTSSTSYVDVTGLSVSITPSSASNKILVMASLEGASNTATSGSIGAFVIVRDSTQILIADSSGSRFRASATIGTRNTGADAITIGQTKTFLDSPATTSSVTYKVQATVRGGTFYLNRTETDGDSNLYVRSTSMITVMEVAG
jgi:hypothetical protein